MIKSRVPRHIGIILDGNRRFSKRLMLKPFMGHEWGAKKLEALFDWCKELKIKELTLYCLSIENFNRPKEEFDYLMSIFRKELKKYEDDERIHKDKVRFNFIGRLYMLPQDIQDSIQRIIEKTKKYNKYQVNFAMAYGGRAEVIDAIKKIAEQLKKGKLNINQINEETFSDYLYMKDEPDLIIRTGGEKRTSNFLPWQSTYSEFIFLDCLWPEFSKEEFVQCIQEYSARDRRFGK